MSDEVKLTFKTPEGTVSYPHLAEPDNDSVERFGGTAKYKLTLVFDKKPEVIVKAIAHIAEVEKLKKYESPLHMYDDDHEQFASLFYITPRTTYKPACFDIDGSRVEGDELVDCIYPGAKAKANLSYYISKSGGKAFINLALKQVKKTADGDRLGGGDGSGWEDDEDDDLPF